MHYSWHVTFLANAAWASATLAAIESMASGMNPDARYVQQTVSEYQQAWQRAKDEDTKFLKKLKITREVIATIIARATSPDLPELNWEPDILQR